MKKTPTSRSFSIYDSIWAVFSTSTAFDDPRLCSSCFTYTQMATSKRARRDRRQLQIQQQKTKAEKSSSVAAFIHPQSRQTTSPVSLMTHTQISNYIFNNLPNSASKHLAFMRQLKPGPHCSVPDLLVNCSLHSTGFKLEIQSMIGQSLCHAWTQLLNWPGWESGCWNRWPQSNTRE